MSRTDRPASRSLGELVSHFHLPIRCGGHRGICSVAVILTRTWPGTLHWSERASAIRTTWWPFRPGWRGRADKRPLASRGAGGNERLTASGNSVTADVSLFSRRNAGIGMMYESEGPDRRLGMTNISTLRRWRDRSLITPFPLQSPNVCEGPRGRMQGQLKDAHLQTSDCE
jgi:hypothetical protein